ncbi:hypothetical protein K491DRAFT_713459 [Lophiostoma macrostomum CBS 122681]|uniref:Uncharacterized protein n=1 Tax=Lophiostoma macrostomum CBS 122681 TaxID=1314788 RepID=A0A6A6TGF7_9PLEO|nr:hypothetical protein K491DRAFT_713459 [Lophiostoma macrostomum CBS 122681]
MGFNRGTQNMDYIVLQQERLSQSGGKFAARAHGSLYWARVKPYGSRAYEGSDERLLEEYEMRGHLNPTVAYKKTAPAPALASKPMSVYEQIHGAPKETGEVKMNMKEKKQRHVSVNAGAKRVSMMSARAPSASANKKNAVVPAKASGVKEIARPKKTLGVKDAGVKKTTAAKKVVPKKTALLQLLEEVSGSSD